MLASPVSAQRNRRSTPPPKVRPAVPVEPAGPEYVGVVQAIANGRAIDLERGEPSTRFKMGFMGVGGAKVMSQVPGEKSPVRFAAGSAIEFLTRVTSQDIDPISYVSLYRMKSYGKFRRLKLSQTQLNGASSTDNEQKIAIAGSKYGSRFYRVRPLAPLPPGEYMIKAGSGTVVYMFGID